MSQKSPSKSKNLANADLNFVSQQAFEQVIEQLSNLRSRNIQPIIMQVDEDTAVFQLQFVRGDDTTAEVSGRLKRWAGNMTHIYCDGRVFRERNWIGKLLRWAIDWQGFLVLWFITSLWIFGDPYYSRTFLELIFFSFLFALISFGLFHLVRSSVIMVGQAINPKVFQYQNQQYSKPEAKDRERLFHAITSIIRDDEISKGAIERLETKPLTEAEEALLIAHITKEANEKYS